MATVEGPTAGAYTITIADDGGSQTVNANDLVGVLAKVTGTGSGQYIQRNRTFWYLRNNAVYNSGVISEGLGDEAVSISDQITVAQANALDAKTSGTITATISNNDGDNKYTYIKY